MRQPGTPQWAPERLGGRDRVLAALSRFGALSRAELARRASMAPSTVSSIVAGLVDAGVVVEVDGGSVPAVGTRGGRPATLLAMHRSTGAVVGIDFGKRHVRLAVVDLAHTLLAERSHPLVPDRPAGEHIRWAGALLDEALQAAGTGRHAVVGVGAGIPGPVRGANGRLGDATILPGWTGVDATHALSEALGLPVEVDNDANLGALSEWTWGAARGCSEVAYVKISTGIGAGLILGGRPFRGIGGTAGEIGHTVIDPAGPICRCGNRGCVEMLAGADAIVEALRPAHGDTLAMRDVIALARDGDGGCRRAIDDAGRAIGTALATLCNMVNPGCVVVGGELGAAGELLLAPLRTALDRGAIRSAAQDVNVVEGTLGDRAEVLGAVALALRSATPLTGS